MEFKNFLLESEKNMADVRATLLKIPAKHKALAKNYKSLLWSCDGTHPKNAVIYI